MTQWDTESKNVDTGRPVIDEHVTIVFIFWNSYYSGFNSEEFFPSVLCADV